MVGWGRRLIWLLAGLPIVTGPGAHAALRAGVGRAEITPPVGTPLGGYGDRKGKPSTGAHDPLFAKALVLADGGAEIGIVTTDLIGTNPEIKRLVAERAGIPAERLLLCASHTHSGPGAFGKGVFAAAVLGAYDQRFFDFLVERIAQSVREARRDLAPARFGAAAGELPGYCRNRRKGCTLTDPQLTVLRVDRADGKPLVALFQYTAHGTVLGADNMLASGDWMGVSQALLEKEIPGVLALYANGAEGDQSPGRHDDLRGFARAEAIGTAVGHAALDLYRKTPLQDSLRAREVSAEMALPETVGGKLIGAGKTTFLQAIGLNDALLIAVPGEMIAELGLNLKARARERGWKVPLIVGLANDHLGYLLTEAEFKKGGYEASVSLFGEKFGDQLTAELEQLVGRLPSPQAPASLLERLKPERLQQVRRDVAAHRQAARPSERSGDYLDIRAAMHVHSRLSHDSRGTAEELVAAAKQAGVRALFMTDHPTADRKWLLEQVKGMKDGVLFIPGAEISDGLLVWRTDGTGWSPGDRAAAILEQLRSSGGVGFIAHPEQRRSWDLPFFAGMEIYNTHADAEDNRPVDTPLFDPKNPVAALALLSAFRQYPVEAFGAIFDPPVGNLERWDALTQTRHVTGIAGNDAHQNVGLAIDVEGDRLVLRDGLGKEVGRVDQKHLPPFLLGVAGYEPGKRVLDLHLDPYPVSLGYVSTHLLANEFSEPALFDALLKGRAYVAFDWLADPSGFLFTGETGGRRGTMGDTLPAGAELAVRTSLAGRIRLLRNGKAVAEARGRELKAKAVEPGVYRVEVSLPVAGDDRAWIYSNPIYVGGATCRSARRPIRNTARA